MDLFINIFLYTSISFLVIMLLWVFKTFFDTRSRYRTSRMLNSSVDDLKALKQQLKTAKRSIVLEGDGSEKSIFLLKKAFDKIKQGLIFKNNEGLKPVNNLDNKEQQGKDDDT